MSIPLPPETPSRNAPTEFSVRMDAYLAWLSGVIPLLNALAVGATNSGVFNGIDINGVAQFDDGVVTAPSIAFSSALNTGFMREATGGISMVVAGVKRMLLSSTGMTIVGRIGVDVGSEALPAIYGGASNATGIYFPAAGEIAISTAGVKRFHINAAGALSGSAITSSSTDNASASKLMRVGDFGVGRSVLLSGAIDLNTRRAPGNYTIAGASTVTNGPSTAGVNSIKAMQIAIIANNDQNDGSLEQRITVSHAARDTIGDLHYHRTDVGGTWGAWVCEEGLFQEAVNGWSIKFANGMMICGNENITSAAVSTASGSIFTNAANQTWTFPIPFAAGFPPEVSFCQSGNAAVWGVCHSRTVSAAQFRLFSGVSQATGPSFGAIAIGRWATGTIEQ